MWRKVRIGSDRGGALYVADAHFKCHDATMSAELFSKLKQWGIPGAVVYASA
jgi:hypothetical protein